MSCSDVCARRDNQVQRRQREKNNTGRAKDIDEPGTTEVAIAVDELNIQLIRLRALAVSTRANGMADPGSIWMREDSGVRSARLVLMEALIDCWCLVGSLEG